jgi:predicted hydrocarbon binding protein
MGRVVLLALQDVVEEGELGAVLDKAALPDHAHDHPPHDLDLQLGHREISCIMQALVDIHGAWQGQQLARQVGRAAFRHGVGTFGTLFGLADLDRRLLPLRIKLRAGLDAMTSVFNDLAGQQIEVDGEIDHYICTVQRCPVCWHRRADAPCCSAVSGLLEEMIHWIGGGERYRVQETSCIAVGDAACEFTITTRPPDEAPDKSGARL